MQLKLSNSDRQEDTSSDDHNVAVASKLGIVKLGKVAGKVFLHSRSSSANYLLLESPSFIPASPHFSSYVCLNTAQIEKHVRILI